MGDAGRSAGVERAANRMTSMMTPNRAAPGGARPRGAAHVRPRRTCRPNARVIGAAPHSLLLRPTTLAARCRVRCTRASGRATGEEQTFRRVARVERAATTTRPTGRGEAAGAAFARAHDHIPLSVRCERRDGGVGGWRVMLLCLWATEKRMVSRTSLSPFVGTARHRPEKSVSRYLDRRT